MDYALSFSLLFFHETSPYLPVSIRPSSALLWNRILKFHVWRLWPSPPRLFWDQRLARSPQSGCHGGSDHKLLPQRQRGGEERPAAGGPEDTGVPQGDNIMMILSYCSLIGWQLRVKIMWTPQNVCRQLTWHQTAGRHRHLEFLNYPLRTAGTSCTNA